MQVNPYSHVAFSKFPHSPCFASNQKHDAPSPAPALQSRPVPFWAKLVTLLVTGWRAPDLSLSPAEQGRRDAEDKIMRGPIVVIEDKRK